MFTCQCENCHILTVIMVQNIKGIVYSIQSGVEMWQYIFVIENKPTLYFTYASFCN